MHRKREKKNGREGNVMKERKTALSGKERMGEDKKIARRSITRRLSVCEETRDNNGGVRTDTQ